MQDNHDDRSHVAQTAGMTFIETILAISVIMAFVIANIVYHSDRLRLVLQMN